jgi:hypothetical protein
MKIGINKVIFVVLSILVLAIFGIINTKDERQNNIQSYLIRVANDNNQDLPIIINSETRLDYTEALSWNKFGYYYTLLLETYGEIDIEDFENFVKPSLINNAKTNAERNNFRKFKITQVYFFRDKNGKDLTEINVTYNEYK